jgi:CelD/BcsL family acetyltransferase involved in cellulose biosynthesis
VLQSGFSAVDGLWRRLVEEQAYGSVFLTPQWQEVWWERFGTGSRELRVLLVGHDSERLGLAPMMREGDTLSFVGSTDLYDYQDFIFGSADPADFYPALARCLGAEPWRTLDLRSIRESSPTLQHLPDRLRLDG